MSRPPDRLLVCGSRQGFDEGFVRRTLGMLWWGSARNVPEVLIVGGAPGVDTYAEAWALANEIPARVFRAEWEKYGKRAGPIRNQRMLDEGKPSVVLAFWDGRSPGTLDMIRRSVQAGLSVRIVARASSPPADPEKESPTP